MRLNELNENVVGKEIDLDESYAWDLKGYWITDDNRILDVDHDNGIHHGDIAMDEFDFGIEDPDDDPSDDDYVREQAIEAAFFDGWIRISSSNNEDTYNVDYTNADKGALKILYKKIRNDDVGFSTYRTPDDKELGYQEMLRWVRLQMKITEGFEQDPYTAEYKFDFDPKTVTKDEFNEMVRALNDKIGTADPIFVNGKKMATLKDAGKELMRLIQPRIDAKKKAEAEHEAKWAPHRWDAPGASYAKQAEMVPVRWLKRHKGNELRLGSEKGQVLGYNPDIGDYEYGDMEGLVASIKERGIQEPIMIVVGMRDGYAYVGEGNHRIEAAEILDMKELPTRVVVQNEANMDFGPRNYTHNVRKDLTWNPDELGSFPEEKYYTKPSQVFKSLSKNKVNESIEKVERHDGTDIPVLVNPNYRALRNFFNKSQYKELRGLYNGNDFFFWDAELLIHGPMAQSLGIKYDDQVRLDVKHRADDEIIIDHSDIYHDEYKMEPWIQSNVNIEDHGWEDFVLKEAMEYTANEKLWIKPEGGDAKIVDITGKTEHHTEHAYKYPQKYGLSGNVFKDYDYETFHDGSKSSYDDHVAEVMFDAGWVRYHQRYEDEAAIHGATFETVAKALQWLRKNARQFDTVVAQSFDDDVTLFNQRDIKSFARTGKKPQSKTSQFRENEELDESFDQPYDYKWETQADESWIGKFTTADGSSVMLELEGYKTSWRIAFDRDGAFGTTGKGDEFKIFGTILSMLSEFVSEMKPTKLFFIAEKNPDPNKKNNSRIKLYRQLIRRFATKHGFNFDEEDQGFKTTFRLDKELNEFKLPFTKSKKEKEMIEKHGGLWKHSVKSLQRFLDDPSKIINKHLRQRYTSALNDKRRMLATESLNEYADMEMPYGSKGAWISPEGTEHVIGSSSHENYIKRFYPKEYPDVAFSKALEDGWTRVTFPLSQNDGFGFNALKKNHIQRALKRYLSDIRSGQHRVDVEWGFNAYDLNSRGVYKILDYDKSRQFIDEGKKKLIYRGVEYKKKPVATRRGRGDRGVQWVTKYGSYSTKREMMRIIDNQLDADQIKEDKKEDTLELPDLHVGDELLVGKFKNRKATIKGFKTDPKTNHPIAKTNKGDQQIFKGRVKKLMPEKEELKEYKVHGFDFKLPPYSVNVIENPNAQQLMTMLKKTDYNEIRGLVDERALYIWPSFTFIHDQIANKLGLGDDNMAHLTLEQNQESGQLTASLRRDGRRITNLDILQSFAPWQRATKYLNTDNMVVETIVHKEVHEEKRVKPVIKPIPVDKEKEDKDIFGISWIK